MIRKLNRRLGLIGRKFFRGFEEPGPDCLISVACKSPDNVAHVSVSRNAFSPHALKKTVCLTWTLWHQQIECGLAWSVLLSTTIRVITVVKICCGFKRRTVMTRTMLNHI